MIICPACRSTGPHYLIIPSFAVPIDSCGDWTIDPDAQNEMVAAASESTEYKCNPCGHIADAKYFRNE